MGWDIVKKASIIVALCIGLMLVGCSGKAAKTSQAVNTEVKQTEEGQGIDVFGEVEVETTRDIFVDFPARVEKIYVKDGKRLNKGDKIMTLNFDEYETDIKKKQNEISQLEAQLKQLRQNVNPLIGEVNSLRQEISIKDTYLNTSNDPDILALKRSLEIADAAEKTARKEYEADKEIFGIGGISSKELEESKQNFNSKEKDKKDILESIKTAEINRRLEVEKLQAALKNNEAQLTNTDKENETGILELESRIKTAKLDLESMKNKFAKAYIQGKDIVADIDNMIICESSCNEGTILGSNENPALKAMLGDTMYVSVDVPEEFISKVVVGSQVDIVPYADKEKIIKGKVVRLAERGIKKNGETIIKADIEPQEKQDILKPGLTVDVKIYE